MKRVPLVGLAMGAVVVGACLYATNPMAPSLPDVQVPAIELSNAEGMDPTAVWLDLFTQASGNNPGSFGTNLVGPGPIAVPGEQPLVVIDPQAQDFERILDGVVGRMGNPLDAVTSAINGPDAVTYLIRNGDS